MARSSNDPPAGEGPHRPRVDLFIGAHCNNDCLFCNEGGRSGRRRSYSLDEARALLRQTAALETIFLTGGEPTLETKLTEFATLARAHGGRHVVLITNGRRLQRRALAQALLTSGINEIRISLHGHTAELHDNHTRRPGSFAQVQRGLATLSELRATHPHRLIVLVVVTRLNLPHLDSIYRFARRHGADRVGYGIVRPAGLAAANFDRVIPRYAEVGRTFKRFLSDLSPRRDPVNVDSLPPCLVPHQLLFLGARMRLVSLAQDGGVLVRDEFFEKTKGPPCTSCALSTSCEGVWEGYVARHGWSEFPPLASPPWLAGDSTGCPLSRPTAGAGPEAPALSICGPCNNGCLICAESMTSESGKLPAEAFAPHEVLARLERMVRAGAPAIDIVGGVCPERGGEPTLSAHLEAVLTRCRELGVEAALFSNGRRLAYQGYFERLRRNPPARLVVPLFGPDSKRHDAVSRVAGSHAQTLEGIRNARRAGWTVEVVSKNP